MSCLGNQQNSLLRGTKIIQAPTSRTIIISYSQAGLTDEVGGVTLEDAITATGVSLGDAAPTDSNCLAQGYDVESYNNEANAVCKVNWTYVGYDFYGSSTQSNEGDNLSYSYSSSLDSDQTNYEYTDPTTPLKVYYWADPANINTAGLGAQIYNGATVSVLKPYTTKTVSLFYIVPSGFPDDTIAGYQAYVGYSNSDTWDSGDPKTWLFMGLNVTPVGLPQQVRLDFTFMYKDQTWISWAFCTQESNGMPPVGSLKNPADPTQNIPTTGSNAARGFFTYPTVSFTDTFQFQ